ncbi:hypothetical protein [Carboxylicivirga sp. RSCT41]|uniref:hypothetical protein n=1 Tax=Carboxylicivirga agarovorans TaxID=3417570 RepID=UPI003D34DDBD
MRNITLISIIILLISCQSNTKSHKEQSKVLFDKEKDYWTIMKTKYNSDNLPIQDNVLTPYARGIYLDTIKSITKYVYDINNCLTEKRSINKTFNIETTTIYKYDNANHLSSKIKIKDLKDTMQIVDYEYSEDNDFKIVKTTKFEKSPLKIDNENVSFDTVISLEKNKYSQNLIIKSLQYSIENEKQELNKSITYLYNYENKLIHRFTIDNLGDTIRWKKIEYKDGNIVKDELFLDQGNKIVSTVHNDLGYIEKIININNITGERDTSYMSCDGRGNVIMHKWKQNNFR